MTSTLEYKNRDDILKAGILSNESDDRGYTIEGSHNQSHEQQPMTPRKPLSSVVSPGVKSVILKHLEWTPLATAYFSPRNIQIIQNALRAEVHAITGKVIAQQDEFVLLAIMQSTYLQFCANDPRNVKEQISWLNSLVIKQSVNQISEAIDMDAYYLSTAFSIPEPIDRPINASSDGRKNESRFIDPGF
jgi:hypothetical protein